MSSKIKIFLCYAKEDLNKVRRLCYRLEDEGFAPWLDDAKILSGQEREPAIEKAIKNSDLFILCLTENSVINRGFKHNEIIRALKILAEQEVKPYLIPVRLHPCDIPDHLSKMHWADIYSIYRKIGFNRFITALKTWQPPSRVKPRKINVEKKIKIKVGKEAGKIDKKADNNSKSNWIAISSLAAVITAIATIWIIFGTADKKIKTLEVNNKPLEVEEKATESKAREPKVIRKAKVIEEKKKQDKLTEGTKKSNLGVKRKVAETQGDEVTHENEEEDTLVQNKEKDKIRFEIEWVRIKKEMISRKETSREGNFTAYDNGVVYDSKTELLWYVGLDNDITWSEAEKWVKNLTLYGVEWRMPTLEELRSLYKKSRGTRNMTPLLETTGWYIWASKKKDSPETWSFNFYHGTENRYNRTYSTSDRAFAVRSRKK